MNRQKPKKPFNRHHSATTPRPKKKKFFGQHFLRCKGVVHSMVERVAASCKDAVVLEIGCGDGFLTEQILAKTQCRQLVCIEIDDQWAALVSNKVSDPRLKMINANALDINWERLRGESDKPMVMLSNLPYNVTFPIMKKLRLHASAFSEGVIMVQEEVAQKFVAKGGRAFGSASLLLQHAFDMELMQKIGPKMFSPPPKVDSRLVYFRPKAQPVAIEGEEGFWKFIRSCFACPRRMLRNNLKSHNFSPEVLDEKVGGLRAQQMSFEQLLDLWSSLHTSSQEQATGE